MTQASFESKAPERFPAVLWAVIFILLPASAVLGGAWWSWLLAVPCLALASALLLSVLFPGLFLRGVRRYAGGFEVRSVLRRPKAIDYAAITQIEAVVLRDGDMGFPFVDLVIRTARANVRVSEGHVRETGLLAELQKLPGFDAEAYAMAEQYEPSGWRELVPKRFQVLRS